MPELSVLRRRPSFAAVALAVSVTLMVPLTAPQSASAATPVGQGFTITTSDLSYILKQIKIAEAHAASYTPANPCGTLLGTGPTKVPDPLTSYGLRTVDGSCNNLIAGRETFGAADELFPRLTTPVFSAADAVPTGFGTPGPSSYAQKSGNVFDGDPRMISNLIVDQTSTNPAAIAAAGFPIRTQGNPGLFPCTTDPDPSATPEVVGVPAQCVPKGDTLFIPNVTTDVGLSPPYNSLFTLFGQFFDHGVDQTVKGGGTVFVPLKADDPLRTVGPDAKPNTGDEVPANQAFMVLTRAQNQPGADGVLGTADDVQEAANTDSPYVDQSQTYTSHASHQVFLREYVNNVDGKPVSTGRLLGGPAGPTAGGMATWNTVKEQAAELLGLRLEDKDVTNIPQLAVDPYGKFLPGPLRGLPQYATASGLIEGDTANPVPVPADVLYFNTPFLTDIAHNADPSPIDHDNNPGTPKVTPTPDTNTTASADFASQAPGTYDDEMLGFHFAAGDGRVNENIGLTAIHQIFHSEHDRLADEFKTTLTNDTSATGVAALADWKLAAGADGWNGERLFQAARFVTEMEYQHIVFEDFGRKVQPAIDPFHVYHTDLDPAVKAEFAHAVYRFGHSMLTETISRTNEAGVSSDIGLLEGFLNPPAYTNDGSATALTSEEAAGSIVMGMSDQVGNELDEFVTGTLRNNLLGLPLDLATLNMTRAREAGIPSLNVVRSQIFNATGDAQLAPYTSWADFGQNVKHVESVINFVAAYGKHPTIQDSGPDGILGNTDDVTTLAAKRAAAKAIVDPGTLQPAPDADASDFMNSAGIYADQETGVNDIDLWVGGLAEKTNLFGGLLGSTFNYVFENQMVDLQNGDRFYYLLRTPGMNLRAQLEGNSFAELAMRNTTANSLKADAFATADCKFQLKNLAGTPAGYAASGATVADDTTSECDESKLLLRKPDGTIQYRETNVVDPSGINGQSVYNGTAGVDRVTGGNDNDTFLGNEGNDVIEGQGGDDIALGGIGDDRITDLAGDDVPKGGPGNDYINAGIGLDIVMGGDGNDFSNGGGNDNETFAGEGNDFIQSGDGSDVSFGDGGDDWIQGGAGQDLLIGDHAAPFFDDPAANKPGNDIFVGQVGENDYDSEGGDDVMTSNAAIDRYSGAAGFDWANHQYDTVAADDDMSINNNLVGVPLPVVVNRDRWQEVEANSGSAFNDTIRGDDEVPVAVGGAGFTGCDALDQAGLNRIVGLDDIVPTLSTPAAQVAELSAQGACPLAGNVWGDGNILLGGIGSDLLEGRGADDILDGDRYLKVRISVRNDAGAEIGTTDLMEKPYLAGSPRTLAADVAAGVVNPGNLVAVREIVTPTSTETTGNRDSAAFSDIEANYTVTTVGGTGVLGSPGSVTTVVHNGGGADGTDTLRNIERLQFSDTALPAAPVAPTAVAGNGQATVNVTPPPGTVTGFTVRVLDANGDPVGTLRSFVGTARALVVTDLTNGESYRFQVAAVNAEGTGAFSAVSNAVTPSLPLTVAGAPTIGVPTAGNASATVNWTAPANNGGTPVTGYSIRTYLGTSTTAFRTTTVGDVTSAVIGTLTNGTGYRFDVRAINAVGTGLSSARTTTVTPVAPVTAPAAPTIGTPTAGNASVTVRWTAPANTGGSAITGYSIRTYVGTSTTPLRTTPVGNVSSTVIGTLTNGTGYRFDVRAVNAVGTGATSARTATVTPIATVTAPAAPTIGAPTAANASVTVRWTAPANTGGSAITGYSIRTYVGTSTTPLRTTPVANVTSSVIATLTNGTGYQFDVRAVNAVGTGAASARTATVTPAVAPVSTAPAAPTIGAPTAANASVTVRWTAPANTGGSAITGYSIRTYVGTSTTVFRTTAVGNVTSTVIGTLANQTGYTFDVRAINAIGTGATSARTAVTTPRTEFVAPTVITFAPAPSGTNIARNVNASILYSEAVTGFNDVVAGAPAAKIVNVATGAVIPAVNTMSANRVTINPTASLAANTQYRVTVTGGTTAVRDLAGNPVPTRTWVFTTGSAF